jgi:predicted ribosomally synthesized peptide with SipW-like signal peptide
LATLATNSYFTDRVTSSGNVFSTGTWPTTPKIVINEVYYHGRNEWIELYNVGDAIVDVKGWIICDNALHCGILNPERKTEIVPGGFVVIAHDAEDLKDWNIPDTAEKIYYAGRKIGFNDDGDSVILKNAEEMEIDQMSYGKNAAPEGYSLERNPKGTGNFAPNPSPTPGF